VTGRIRRRDLIALVGLLPIAIPASGRSQPAERIRRIGYLTPATGAPEDLLGVLETRALVEGLRELGWVDGRNITIEHRFSGSGRERVRTNAKELVEQNPDVILSVGGPPLAALLVETRTIPIVFTLVSDPVGSGFVANLARPGGNVTGFAAQEGAIAGKWLELLKEVAPQVIRVAVLMEADSPPQLVLRDAVAAAAASLKITLATVGVRDLSDVEREIGAFASEPGGGVVVLPNTITVNNQQRIHALAAQYRLPAVYSYPIYAQTGGLISYGTNPVAQFRDAAGYIDRILRGEKPGNLPVQLPTRFVLVINLKTAKALGLTIPPAILARADEVIE
jgi:putative ABC transport system substrate-binding protein